MLYLSHVCSQRKVHARSHYEPGPHVNLVMHSKLCPNQCWKLNPPSTLYRDSSGWYLIISLTLFLELYKSKFILLYENVRLIFTIYSIMWPNTYEYMLSQWESLFGLAFSTTFSLVHSYMRKFARSRNFNKAEQMHDCSVLFVLIF